MTFSLIKIIDRSVAAALLDAAIKRTNQFRTIAIELRREADKYDAQADENMAAIKDEGHG